MLNNIPLPHTTGYCLERRNKTYGKDIGMFERVAMPVNELLI